MFDQILQMVQQHMNSNPQAASVIPNEQMDAIHQEIASHITNGIQNMPAAKPETGGLLSTIESSVASGGLATSAIEGALVNSLGEKFGLPPAATGAIAGMLPGLLQKLAQSNMGQSVTPQAAPGYNAGGIANELQNPLGGNSFGSLLSGL